MPKVILPLLIVCVISLLITSCANTKKIVYFNNVPDAAFKNTKVERQSPIKPNDILSISISSANAEASQPFNLQNNNISRATTVTGSNNESGGYLVNANGTIDLPVLGAVQAAGLTKEELKEKITNLILSKKLLIDPIVDIRYLNYEVTVLGEVAKPTVITVPNEKISLLKALGLAGDLTIYGKRDNILIIRDINGKKEFGRVNLNGRELFNSPYYYLHSGDLIYVEQGKGKIASSDQAYRVLPIIISTLTLITLIIYRLK